MGRCVRILMRSCESERIRAMPLAGSGGLNLTVKRNEQTAPVRADIRGSPLNMRRSRC
jgi:hypothetical protein